MERRSYDLASPEGERLRSLPGAVISESRGVVTVGPDCFGLVGTAAACVYPAPCVPADLREHQNDSLEFVLSRGGGLIGDPPGAGKTRTALEAVRAVGGPTLVLGPAVARGTWACETLRWLGIPVLHVRGRDVSEFDVRTLSTSSILFVNYDVIADWGPILGRIVWGAVVLDEVHRVKARRNSWVSGTAEAFWQNRGPVIALSATPVWSSIIDLYRILHWVHPGSFGGYWDFARRYCGAYPAKYGWMLGTPTNTEELRARLSYFYIRHEGATATPVSRQALTVDSLEARLALCAGGEQLTRLLSRREAVQAAVQSLLGKATAAKIKELPGLLDERPTLITCHTRTAVASAVKLLRSRGFAVVGITGADPLEVRQGIFANPAWDVVVATRDSVRESIDGRRFKRLVVVDLAYVPDELVQLEGRLTRGQPESVSVDYMVITDSFDSALLSVLLRRLSERESSLGDSAQYAAVASALGMDMSNQLADLAARLLEVET